MSLRTDISWCDSSANIVIGCDKVSAGCAHCYAQYDTPARVLRARGVETWGPAGQRIEVKGYEKSVLAMNRRPWICDRCGHATAVTEWTGSPGDRCPECGGKDGHARRIFHGSNNDWLDTRWPIELLAKKLDVIRRAPDCIHILCTKRPENWEMRIAAIVRCGTSVYTPDQIETLQWLDDWYHGEAPKNIIGLCSIEDQPAADERISKFLQIPFARHGLSLEPLLCPVDLSPWIWPGACGCMEPENEPIPGDGFKCAHCRDTQAVTELDWLIIGGESGRGARACLVGEIRALVRQGQAAGVKVFVKQLGAAPIVDGSTVAEWPEHVRFDTWCERPHLRVGLRDKKGGDITEWPADLRVRQWPRLPAEGAL